MSRILIIEDEESIAELEKDYLELSGFEVEIESKGDVGLKRALEEEFDLYILDLMLPGMDGLEAIRKIRANDAWKKLPVLVLTAKDKEYDKVAGLDGGADDYMTKPFSVSELLARVEALCRRVGRSASAEAGEQAPASLVSGSFVLDENRRVLLKAGKPIELTQVEFQIMELFFRNPGVALVRERILKGVWGENYFGDVKIVDVNIRRLRMKIEDEPSSPQHILTVWGYGYRWNA